MQHRREGSMLVIAGLILLTFPLAVVPVHRVEAAGIAGPPQTVAEGLPVLLGDPAQSGTDPGDTDPGATYHWRQIIVGHEPYVKLSHIDKTTTMFIAPPVSHDTTFRFGLRRNAEPEVTVDITIVKLAPDDRTNTTFIDHMIAPATCDTYDPATRACGSGTYKAQKTSFKTAWYPLPTPGWRYVFREGTYSYAKTPAGRCQPAGTGVVRIEGTNAANGTPTAPVQFKTYKNGSTWEHVLIDAGGVTDCVVYPQIYIAGSSYVIAEGFEVTGVAQTGRGSLISVGHPSAAKGDFHANPSHHVTLRHLKVHDQCTRCGRSTSGGSIRSANPSHEIAIQYVETYRTVGGIATGISHGQEKFNLPYNFFVQFSYLHDHYFGTQGSAASAQQGVRNSGFYRVVGHTNADACMPHGQGPWMDSNAFWEIVCYRQDSYISPTFGGTNPGNERGAQIGTLGVPGRAALANRVYRSVYFDNMGNGFNDAGWPTDTRAYHLTVFNNCRRRRGPFGNARTGYAGVAIERQATPNPESPGPGATLANTAAYWNGGPTGCQGAGRGTSNILMAANVAPPFSTFITNNVGPNSNHPIDPQFVAPTPQYTASQAQDAPESSVTVDTRLYLDPATRTLNPNFGQVTGLQLRPGSPMIDAGTFISGVHCDRPDDRPSPHPAHDPNCLHWRGRAPDIGAYEHGIK